MGQHPTPSEKGAGEAEAQGLARDGVSLYDAINCISTLFKHLSGASAKKMCVSLVQALWPQIAYILREFCGADGVMEKATRIIKHAVKGGGHAFVRCSVCLAALRLVTSLYCARAKRSSFVYIVCVYVDAYVADTESSDVQTVRSELMASLMRISQCTSPLLVDVTHMRAHSDVVEDFFELMSQFLKKAHAQMLAHFEFVRMLVMGAANGLLIDRRAPNDAICLFLDEVVYFAEWDEDGEGEHTRMVQRLLAECGQTIMARVLEALSGAHLRYEMAQRVAQTLNELFKFDRKRVLLLLQRGVADVEITSVDPSKEQFVEEFASERNDSKYRVRAAMDWYSACERYRRSRRF